MLHPSLNPKSGGHWVKPESMKQWVDPANTMVKLNVLAQIIGHHLKSNGKAPLTVLEDGRTVELDPTGSDDDGDYGEADRIIIYSAFPSSNQAIVDVSNH